MKTSTKRRLTRAGWRVGTAREFLGLSEAEALLVEMRLALSRSLRERRVNQGVSQVALAARMGSSQSRVAKMEAADPTVSLDLLVRTLLALGARREDIARAIDESG
jgi:Helix-turn-helix